MICKISDWGCVYHACMSDECQKRFMQDLYLEYGDGNCNKQFAYTGNGNLSLDDAIAAGKLAATEQESIAGVLADAGENLPEYYSKLSAHGQVELYSRLAGTGWEGRNCKVWDMILESLA
jgi:hypothetical protein